MNCSRCVPLVALLLAAFTVQAQDLSRVPPADQPEATRLFKTYRESPDPAAREAAAKSLMKMHYTVLLAFAPVLERDWQVAVTNYRSAFQRQAAEVARKRSADPAFVKDVATQRATMARLRALDKALTKQQLHDQGEPALKKLRALHAISVADLTAGLPTLGPAGATVRMLTRVRAELKTKTRLTNESNYTEKDVAAEEAAAIGRAFRTDQQYDRVLQMNAELAATKAVPADEAEGVRDLNEMRMLLGLAPVLIDPKLHNAARDHSQDMATKGFFAHESPVPGKRSPGDRARLAGTTAHAENIFMGSPSPQAANRSWFFSPGHHVNMFGGHRRIGMGRYEGHWTQLFGG